MRESRPYGSERGAFSNGRPYRDRTDGHRGRGEILSYSSLRQSMGRGRADYLVGRAVLKDRNRISTLVLGAG